SVLTFPSPFTRCPSTNLHEEKMIDTAAVKRKIFFIVKKLSVNNWLFYFVPFFYGKTNLFIFIFRNGINFNFADLAQNIKKHFGFIGVAMCRNFSARFDIN